MENRRYHTFFLTCSLGALVGLMLIGAGIIGYLLFGMNTNDDANRESLVASVTPSKLPSGVPTLPATATFTPTPTLTPTPTPIPPQAIFGPIQRQAWLETAREEVVFPELYADGDQGIIPGSLSLKYRAFFDVTGGVDLSLVTLDDIVVDGTTVTITLPQAQVRECIANQEKSGFYDRDCSRGPGLGDWPGCRGLEDELINKAQDRVVSYDYANLVNKAYTQAATVVESLIRNVSGVEHVNIRLSEQELPLFSVGGTCSILAEH
ncbi:MAG: DUF4230 domain-containing protein [Chloroflexi bacterium]|nr:DUF4230 domain-containing protein [Chloroflexota bacterium]